MAQIPGVPEGGEMPTRTGIALIIVLSPFALIAGILDGMARFPVFAILGGLLGGVFASFADGDPASIVVTASVGGVLALSPAAIRWAIIRARRPHG